MHITYIEHIKPANFCVVIAIAKLSSCRSTLQSFAKKELGVAWSALRLHKKPLRKLIRAASQRTGKAKWLHEMVFCTRNEGGVEHRQYYSLKSSIRQDLFYSPGLSGITYLGSKVKKSFKTTITKLTFVDFMLGSYIILTIKPATFGTYFSLSRRGSWFDVDYKNSCRTIIILK